MASKKQRLKQLQGNWTASEISITFRPGVINETVIASSENIYPLVLSLWDKELINLQEQVMVFFFNGRNKVIGYRVLCTGSMETCIIDVRLLASLALHSLATFVILAHNHPSGNLRPSVKDIQATFRIKKALKTIDVQLMDHLIISERGWLSMRVEGLL